MPKSSPEKLRKAREYYQKRKDDPAYKKYMRDYHAEWYPKNRAVRLAHDKEHRQQLKMQVMHHYSGGVPACACCGEKEIAFLTIYHINGGGGKQRRAGLFSTDLYRWLIKHGFPKGYRIMCMNCNFAIRYGETCPHRIPIVVRGII